MKICAICNVECTKRCPECYIDDAVYYCSKEHQIQDRKNHLLQCCRLPIMLQQTKFEFGHSMTISASHVLTSWKAENIMNYFFVLKSFPLEMMLKNVMEVDCAIFAQLIQWAHIQDDQDFIFGLGPYACQVRLNEQAKILEICRPMVLHPKDENFMLFMGKAPSIFQHLLEYKDGTLLGQSTNGPKRGNKEFWVHLCLESLCHEMDASDIDFLKTCQFAHDWYLGPQQMKP